MPSCLSLLCRTEEVQTLSDCHDKLQYHRREPTLQPSWSVCRRGRCVKTELTPRRLLIFLSNHLSGYLNKNSKSILRKHIPNLGSSNNNPNLQASSALSVRPLRGRQQQIQSSVDGSVNILGSLAVMILSRAFRVLSDFMIKCLKAVEKAWADLECQNLICSCVSAFYHYYPVLCSLSFSLCHPLSFLCPVHSS